MKPGRPVLAALVAVLATSGCRARQETRLAAEEAILERRQQGLEALIAQAHSRSGRLIHFDDVLVVVRQDLVQQVLDGALPLAQTVSGKYDVTIAACRVRFEDGFALVELSGRASLVSHKDVAAEVTVYGGIDVVELDEASSILRGRVKVFAVEARRVDMLGVGALAEGLVEDLSREKLTAFAPLLSAVEIPVRLDGRITIPALGPAGGVTVPAAEVPLGLQVVELKSFRHRLFVTLKAAGGSSPASPSAKAAKGDGTT